MHATELFDTLGDKLRSGATVKSVFGDPIHSEGKTVVPVAKVAFGFGGGVGSKHGKPDEEGGGGGGGARAFPAGVLEITPQATRFVPFHDLRWVLGAFAAGALVAGAAFRLRR